jgi:hypothetical protein
MISLDNTNIDQILDEFSSEELIDLSDDLLRVAMELTLRDDLDLPEMDSIARGNDLLVIIPKIIASRLNKAEIFSRKFAELKKEDLVFAGYSIVDLRNIRKLLEDVINLVEKRTQDDLHVLYREIFEELKDTSELDPTVYRNALKNVNEAYRIQSRHLMTRAIDIYKRVMVYDFEVFLSENVSTLDRYREHLNNAVELLETSDLGEKFSAQLKGLRKTLILVLEALNANTIGAGFSEKKISFIHDILYHIRHNPEEYIFEVIRRFANISQDRILLDYMTPEEIAIRYRTRYIKHNRVLVSFISNPVHVDNDFVLEVVNNILKNLSVALNVKLQFNRTNKVCDQIITASSKNGSKALRSYTQQALDEYYRQVRDVLTILEKYTIRSNYLDTLQGKCYRAAIAILEWFRNEFILELADILRRYRIYAARKLFTLRISTLCTFISAHTPDELSQIASEKVLGVCRDLIQYQYDFLKPTSAYLEAVFDLEKYRLPVLSKVDAAIQLIQTGQVSQISPEQPLRYSSEQALQQSSTTSPPSEKSSKPWFSQTIIDCFALKVQELDDSAKSVQEDKSVTKREIRIQINTSKERIAYFLDQYEEESQFFIKQQQKDFDMLEEVGELHDEMVNSGKAS